MSSQSCIIQITKITQKIGSCCKDQNSEQLTCKSSKLILNFLWLFKCYNGWLLEMLLFSFYFLPSRPPSRSLSLHLLKSLSRRGAHQISIVDLLMLRSVLHRQRFHTQDEREMNTEDARGWHGALTTPATATLTASLHQAGIWEELRTRGWDWGLPLV